MEGEGEPMSRGLRSRTVKVAGATLVLWMALGGAVWPQGGARNQARAADPRIAAFVAQVSQDRLLSQLNWLVGFGTRNTYSANAGVVANGMLAHFRRLGLPAELDCFAAPYLSVNVCNVVVTLAGRTTPAEQIVIGAHYDSTSPSASTTAPGADDNGSGTAAIMEIARVLSGVRFDRTVKIIAFGGEEQGLYGSSHYASAAKARGDQIIGMISLDMIGSVDHAPEDLDIEGNSASAWLVDRFVSATLTYTNLPTLTHLQGWGGSDHESFWYSGYSAVLAIDDDDVTYPYYHTIYDTVDKLNLPFLTSATKASLAVVADLAGTPTPRDLPSSAWRAARASSRHFH